MNKLQNTHQALKKYGCQPTFPKDKTELKISPVFAGSYFYRPNSEIETDVIQKEWKEEVSIKLDACLKAKTSFAPFGKIRFDIEYSEIAGLYSMYVSLPTHSRSISLNQDRYKTETLLIAEIEKWIIKAGCKRIMAASKQKIEVDKFEQLSLF